MPLVVDRVSKTLVITLYPDSGLMKMFSNCFISLRLNPVLILDLLIPLDILVDSVHLEVSICYSIPKAPQPQY